MRALLVSTYELGHQPFGLASPAAWLRAAGWEVTCVDAAKERLGADAVERATLIGFHLPMHTATRLAGPMIAQARQLNPDARLCAYGLYAPLNVRWLRSLGVDAVFGGEFEGELAAYAATLRETPRRSVSDDRRPVEGLLLRTGVPRLKFLVPDRSGLPPLDRYATLQMPDGTRKLVGYTEASRGCKHLCRHCPVVPVYRGQFRVVAPDVVLADVDAQIRTGAQHITFGDPDFFNGPTHAMRIVGMLHEAHPSITYDVTIKIEHLLEHRELLGRLVDTGCAFVTSAVESIDDHVLRLLDKGHTRQDFVNAVAICQAAGLSLAPTFVAFHPWLTLDGYCDLLDAIETLGLVDRVAPIQLAIRLLIPEGSRLLEVPEVRRTIDGFDASTLSYRWSHDDAALDGLHREVAAIVGVRLTGDRRAIFDEISALAHERAGRPRPPRTSAPIGPVPYSSEPWYCCAEPNPDETRLV